MKIVAIDSFVLSVPTPNPMALQYPQHKLVVAEILADDGIAGLGYSLVFGGGGAEAVHVYLDTRLKPALIGEDPLFVERLWEKMFRTDMGMKKQGVVAYARRRRSRSSISCGTRSPCSPTTSQRAPRSRARSGFPLRPARTITRASSSASWWSAARRAT